jgi:hypothetical protein
VISPGFLSGYKFQLGDKLEGLDMRIAWLLLPLALMEWTRASANTTLIGDVISGSYDFPNASTTAVGQFSYFTNPFVVSGPAPQTTLFIGNPVFYSAWNVFFTGTSLTLTMAPAPLTSALYDADPFNGPVFSVVSGNAFASVTGVNTSLHCTPCDPVSAFVSGGSLYVDWAGAGGVVGDTVTVDFTVAGRVSAVPGPIEGAGTPGLIAASAGLLAWWRRKRNGALAVRRAIKSLIGQPYVSAA